MVFINADDFGYSKEISSAILDLLKMRKIDGTTSLVRQNGSYPKVIGLHLNLTDGKTLCDISKVKSLVKKDGSYYSLPILYLRLFLRLVKMEHLQYEVTSQLNYLKNNCVVNRIDGHRFCQCFPMVSKVLSQIASAHKIKIVSPKPIFHISMIFAYNFYVLFYMLFIRFSTQFFFNIPKNLQFNEKMLGYTLLFNKNKMEILSKLILISDEDTVIMTHPGYLTTSKKIDYYNEDRVLEFRALSELKR